jgi:hypothetical protein
VWEAFGREAIVGGKRIAKGELLASLRVKTLRKLKREHGTVKVCTKNFVHRLLEKLSLRKVERTVQV